MNYYFSDLKEVKKLEKILKEWVGTPYRHRCGVKGLGCDCIRFTAAVFEELEIITTHKNMFPDYPKDWHLHNTREILLEGLERELNVEKIGSTDFMDGDIVLSHYGKAASHSAIYFEGYLYQSLNGIGVCKININDRLSKRQMRFAYRLLK